MISLEVWKVPVVVLSHNFQQETKQSLLLDVLAIKIDFWIMVAVKKSFICLLLHICLFCEAIWEFYIK